MAKSLEDTAFYRYHRLLALNEVGGDPAAKALSVEAFHAMMRTRAIEWPHGMTATATHDTKRGEDARARILALAEIPGEWTTAVARWKLLNAPHVLARRQFARAVGDVRIHAVPDAGGRMAAVARALRLRSASRTMRSRPRARARSRRAGSTRTRPYEDGVQNFIAAILDPERLRRISRISCRRWRSACRCSAR